MCTRMKIVYNCKKERLVTPSTHRTGSSFSRWLWFIEFPAFVFFFCPIGSWSAQKCCWYQKHFGALCFCQIRHWSGQTGVPSNKLETPRSVAPASGMNGGGMNEDAKIPSLKKRVQTFGGRTPRAGSPSRTHRPRPLSRRRRRVGPSAKTVSSGLRRWMPRNQSHTTGSVSLNS